ncbi:MAG: DUF6471 domain-containing protein [Paracoccaceae bacterium]|nr:DUF6471 domain-containing protein [Paracoccaceae bacterium]
MSERLSFNKKMLSVSKAVTGYNLHRRCMPEQNDWESKAANLLKAELKRTGVTYANLARLICEKKVSIRNKLSRSKFSAAFPFQALDAF